MHGLHKIAQVLKSNGIDGELILGFRGIVPEDIDLEEPVFICYDGLPVPFFIGTFRKKGQNKAVVSLTGICSSADAMEVTGQDVYVEASGLDLYDEEDDFSALAGWTLRDGEGNTVGCISGYLDIPGNPCLEISVSGTGPDAEKAIIPLHEDLIISSDAKKQELTMSIPAGLL